MNFQSDHHDDLVLPPWIGRTVAFIVLLVALGVIYYGFHGVLARNIAYTTKAGKVGGRKGLIAIIIGLGFSGIGIGLFRVAWLILKSSKPR